MNDYLRLEMEFDLDKPEGKTSNLKFISCPRCASVVYKTEENIKRHTEWHRAIGF